MRYCVILSRIGRLLRASILHFSPDRQTPRTFCKRCYLINSKLLPLPPCMDKKFHIVPYIPIHGSFPFFMPLATSAWPRAQGTTHIGYYGVSEHLSRTHTPQSCSIPPLSTPKRCLEEESEGGHTTGVSS